MSRRAWKTSCCIADGAATRCVRTKWARQRSRSAALRGDTADRSRNHSSIWCNLPSEAGEIDEFSAS
eukprot:1008229-Pleurochrysis_carterae.AAC.1